MKEEVARGVASVSARAQFFQHEIETVAKATESLCVTHQHSPRAWTKKGGAESREATELTGEPLSPPPTPTKTAATASSSTPVSSSPFTTSTSFSSTTTHAPTPPPTPTTPSTPRTPNSNDLHSYSGIRERRNFFESEVDKLAKDGFESEAKVRSEAARRKAVKDAEKVAYDKAEKAVGGRRINSCQ